MLLRVKLKRNKYKQVFYERLKRGVELTIASDCSNIIYKNINK